jgi:hypothetical protein
MVVDDVQKLKPNCSKYGSLILNCSAHALARAILSHDSRVTFDVISPCIAIIVLNEMS